MPRSTLTQMVLGWCGAAALVLAGGTAVAAPVPTPAVPRAGAGVAAAPPQANAQQRPAVAETEPGRLVPMPPPSTVARTVPAALLQQALQRPATGALTGRPVALVDLLAGMVTRAQRATQIRGYWTLATAVANYHFALERARYLQEIVDTAAKSAEKRQPEVELQAALAVARARVEQTKLAATAAQYRLLELQPALLADDALPLPADAPHTGAYRTLYDRIFAGHNVPVARRLDRTLPLEADVIRARAAAVRAAAECLAAATNRFKTDKASVTSLLACHERLTQQQRGFLDAVRRYNFDIADYAQLAAPEGIDAVRLVAMLIKVKTRPLGFGAGQTDGLSSVLKRSGVVPAGGLAAPGQPSRVVPATAQTPEKPPGRAAVRESRQKDGFVPRRPGLEP